MTIEQQKLLYEIASWHSRQFYNAMNDHWTPTDVVFDSECTKNIEKLEVQYETLYGDLPEWKYIDDVWAAMKELEGTKEDG